MPTGKFKVIKKLGSSPVKIRQLIIILSRSVSNFLPYFLEEHLTGSQ